MGIIKDAYTRVVLKPLADYLKDVAKNSPGDPINKAQTAVLRDTLQYGQTAQYGQQRAKPGSGVDFKTLRRFSEQYDVARACINRRKRQLNQLDWEIGTSDPDDDKDYGQILKTLQRDFRRIGGYKVRFREFVDVMVEDLLVLDAVAIEKRRTVGGGLYALQPFDASTVKLRVDESGRTPEPPEVAYEQWIRGKLVAQFTADEMYYEMMNPRTNSPYGLSPLESLILTVSTALKSELYNLHQLTDGNIPEGYIGVPDTWTADQIKEYQAVWDAALAGNTKAMSRIKFGPKGEYTRFTKPEDIRFKELQEWLMKKTCMLFEIQPQELGFTDTVNKATGEVQRDIGISTGLKPLANFFEEIFSDAIQEDMGFEQFAFHYLGLEYENAKETAETNEILIRSGQRTIDEIRTDQGLQPLGVDKPFIVGSPTFIDEESQQARADAAKALASLGTGNSNDDNEDDGKEDDTQKANSVDTTVRLVSEMRTFRRYAMNRAKQGRKIAPFRSEVLPSGVVAEINKRLGSANGPEQVRDIFAEYMQDFQIDFLANVVNLERDLSSLK